MVLDAKKHTVVSYPKCSGSVCMKQLRHPSLGVGSVLLLLKTGTDEEEPFGRTTCCERSHKKSTIKANSLPLKPYATSF